MGLLILITCVCLLTLGVPVWTIVSPSSGSATESPKVHLTRTPKSQTVMVNHRFEFFCKAEGDGRMKIRWYVNGTKRENELPKRGENYRTLRNGTLRFNKVKVVDRGIYRCKAENGFKDFVFSEPALLTVHAPAQIVRSAETGKERVWDVGSTRHLECVAAGIPLPRIEWRRDGQLIPAMVGNRTEERTDRGTSVASLKSLLTVQVTRSANYSCTASNFPTSDGIPSTDTVSVRVTAVKMSICLLRSPVWNKHGCFETCRSEMAGILAMRMRFPLSCLQNFWATRLVRSDSRGTYKIVTHACSWRTVSPSLWKVNSHEEIGPKASENEREEGALTVCCLARLLARVSLTGWENCFPLAPTKAFVRRHQARVAQNAGDRNGESWVSTCPHRQSPRPKYKHILV
ncbi:hypothetical protein RRG08_059761 [Elysia crispata]|uniref:Ig-like domain-containing protein n=1 Tax=Elysia crispata TaxID=231223 RepID=A0AAE1EEK3_9GAST|nr:hypothetical protein RRG08_059761 [Elysia crispata]